MRAVAALAGLACLLGSFAACGVASTRGTPHDAAGSRAAFLAVFPVFMHPRCVNCHPRGDAPLQGDDSRVHGQNVKRGPEGRGLFALKCTSCHQEANLPGEHMPPGTPMWRMPTTDMPLVFQGLTPRELAGQLKDPLRNDDRTLDQLLVHVAMDPLLRASWNPGDGRTTPPLSYEEFQRKFTEWVEKGAAVPE